MRNLRLGQPVTVIVILVSFGLGLGVGSYFTTGRLIPYPGSVAKLSSPVQPDGSTQLYTCGMHPNVIQEGPGTCPICEMKLTPVNISTVGTVARPAGERKIKYWRAPMDPTYISDKPGKSPMGMDLIPVYEDEVTGAGNVLSINPLVTQNMGVRTEEVITGPLHRVIRTVGHLEYDETKIGTVNLKVSGWVEKAYVDRTGEMVKKGEPLIDIYSPELVSAQEEYLLALKGRNSASLLKSSRRRLEYWDISPQVIDELKESKRVKKSVPIFSPFTGVVTEKKVVEGTHFKAGETLYTIVDLSTIWVYVHIYEYELPWVKEGQTATMTLPYIPGKTFTGVVHYIYPYVNMDTRDVTVRLEFPNAALELKPMMYADVKIQAELRGPAVLVAEEAVIHSGDRQLVFVSLGNGMFEPRDVVIGVVGEDGYAEVIEGVHPGETVVTSGQFMLDSESKLQEAIQKMIQKPAGEAAGEHKEHEMEGGKPVAREELTTPEEMSSPSMEHEHDRRAMPKGGDTQLQAHATPMEVSGDLYVCPMTKDDYFSTQPGRDPNCGMELVPVEEGTSLFACPTSGEEFFSYHPGTCPESGELLVPAIKVGATSRPREN